eukprot:TRINITY_DN20188_c0_g1_i1.p1 TRINITY_DN20188_c0_g1~~TRINITY_DN20188_c0_g1_i1.p1  ORF type:complete len:653 (+),score=136.60 TRINITY_DN20188_c0_g1_i1:183-2141(+)
MWGQAWQPTSSQQAAAVVHTRGGGTQVVGGLSPPRGLSLPPPPPLPTLGAPLVLPLPPPQTLPTTPTRRRSVSAGRHLRSATSPAAAAVQPRHRTVSPAPLTVLPATPPGSRRLPEERRKTLTSPRRSSRYVRADTLRAIDASARATRARLQLQRSSPWSAPALPPTPLASSPCWLSLSPSMSAQTAQTPEQAEPQQHKPQHLTSSRSETALTEDAVIGRMTKVFQEWRERLSGSRARMQDLSEECDELEQRLLEAAAAAAAVAHWQGGGPADSAQLGALLARARSEQRGRSSGAALEESPLEPHGRAAVHAAAVAASPPVRRQLLLPSPAQSSTSTLLQETRELTRELQQGGVASEPPMATLSSGGGGSAAPSECRHWSREAPGVPTVFGGPAWPRHLPAAPPSWTDAAVPASAVSRLSLRTGRGALPSPPATTAALPVRRSLGAVARGSESCASPLIASQADVPTARSLPVPPPATSAAHQRSIEGSEEEEHGRRRCERLKAEADVAFQSKQYERAVALFSEAISCGPAPAGEEDATLYSDRAVCLSVLGRYDEALRDGERCVALRPDWPRGYGRKGLAEFCLGAYDLARQSYLQGLHLAPQDSSLNEGLQQTEQALRMVIDTSRIAAGAAGSRDKLHANSIHQDSRAAG